MSIHTASVLVKITVSSWDGFKKDTAVAQAADAMFNTKGGAGNYNKRLLEKSVLVPVQRICNRVRHDHKFYTIPWCYDGVDLLPSKLYFEYTSVMRLHKDALDVAVSDLVTQYPVHVANQAQALGTMYNPLEYPDAHVLRGKFAINHQFFPVPDAGHFVVDMEKSSEQKLKDDLGKILADAEDHAQAKLNERILDMLEHCHERLEDPSNVFRDSLIDSFTNMVTVLPKLNIFESKKLNIVIRALSDFAFIDPQQLRTNRDERERVAIALHEMIKFLKTP